MVRPDVVQGRPAVRTRMVSDNPISMWSEMELERADDRPRGLSDGHAGVGAVTDATAVVRFDIGGLLRFLSHAETLRLFERACARAGVPVKYSQGFNPHPKLSLPLPRPVGVASGGELLVLRVYHAKGFPLQEGQEAARVAWQDRMKDALAAVLPTGIVIDSVTLEPANASFAPTSVQYVLALGQRSASEAALGPQAKAADLLASESLVLDRMSPKRGAPRRVDVRPFLKAIRFEGSRVIVECGVSNAGTLRLSEMMRLLDVAPGDLAAPIRRKNIIWKTTYPSRPGDSISPGCDAEDGQYATRDVD